MYVEKAHTHTPLNCQTFNFSVVAVTTTYLPKVLYALFIYSNHTLYSILFVNYNNKGSALYCA